MRTLAIVTLATLLTGGAAFGVQASTHRTSGDVVIARNGADDKAGDKKGRNADGTGHTSLESSQAVIARNGADDPAGHDAGDDRGRGRGGHGADDGANHG